MQSVPPWCQPLSAAALAPLLPSGVRLAGPSEGPALTALFSALAQTEWTGGVPASLARGVARFLAQPGGGFALVVEDCGQVVGGLIGQRMAAVFEDGLQICIDDLVVAPTHRRAGHGGALVAGVLAIGRSLGADYIYLHVRQNNPAAQALYRAAGFCPQDDLLFDWYAQTARTGA